MPNDDQIKVSQLPEASSQTGLWVLGVDSNDQSCKFQASLLQGPQGQPGAAAGFGTPQASVDANSGTPSVEISASGPNTAKVFTFAFHNLKGADGASAGFGTPQASVDANTGTPSVEVAASGPDNAKVFTFTFHNLKGTAGASAVRSLTTHTSSDTTVTGLAWDTVHVWPEISGLTFTLAAAPSDGIEHEVVLIFDTPTDASNFTLNYDSSILWGNNDNPASAIANKTRYEIHINSTSMIAVYTVASIPSNS